MNGPIAVTGAEPGDSLRVDILAMQPIRATGWTRAALAENVVDPDFVTTCRRATAPPGPSTPTPARCPCKTRRPALP